MDMKMERLYEAAKALKGIEGQSDVARAMNMSPQTVNNWEARGMSKKGMLLAQAIFGCSATWLDTGIGPMTVNADPLADARVRGIFQDVDAHHHNDNPNVVQIPKVELRVSAGITGFAVDGSDDVDLQTYPLERSWVERHNFSVGKLLAMRVKGDSMFPVYKEGDIIVINTADTKMVDSKEFVFNFDGDVVLKTLIRDGGSWWLTSENKEPRYHRRSVRSGETFIIGRVVKHDRINL